MNSIVAVTHRVNHQRGATIIEVMVAVTISLILLTGVLQIFISNKQTYRINDAMSRLQENARFATYFLTTDLRMAGFYGCGSKATSFVNTLNTTTGVFNFGTPLEALDGAGLNGSDEITVRGSAGSSVAITEAMPNTSADLKTQPAAVPPFADNDIVLISDCTASAAFQITGYTTSNGNTVHNTGGSSVPGNLTKDLGKQFGTDAEIMKVTTKRYYIAAGASGAPALWRQDAGGTPVELVEGVENMQILYGERIAGSTKYVAAGAVTDMANVTSLRIALLLRTMDEAGSTLDTSTYSLASTTYNPTDDRRLRRVVETTITLRNRV
ncbi:MAG: type IV pilus assembly protein PilW [Gammaproteobacteria bacterium]|nr:MAG: type IV pilus assembly protein PilW [Gammaproteobacteria bacterium]TND06688.1 MAG: type IV pilus assembly protein PilW [Gammaproteobacteria bacterium]